MFVINHKKTQPNRKPALLNIILYTYRIMQDEQFEKVICLKRAISFLI
jgi:hypothetical protein